VFDTHCSTRHALDALYTLRSCWSLETDVRLQFPCIQLESYRGSLYALHTLDTLFTLYTLDTLRTNAPCCTWRPLTSLLSSLDLRRTTIVQSHVCYRGANRTLYTLNSLRPGASYWSRRTLTALRTIVRYQYCKFARTENAAPLLQSRPVYLGFPEDQCFQWALAALEAL